MSEPIAYLNGEFLPASRAKIDVYDLGIVLGATFTEFTRTFDHKPFRLQDHLQRLYGSTRYGGIPLPLSMEEMASLTQQLVQSNGQLLPKDADLGVVHFITPGINRIYAGSAALREALRPTICIHSFQMPFKVWRHFYVEGAHVVTPSIRHIPPQCVDPKTKNRSRLHWFLADHQTHAVDSKAVTLLLDLDGNLTECAGSNFVIVKGRTIFSPTSRNILQGISLQTVKELALPLGLAFIEKDLQPYDVINADEAWLTTTPYCLAPCTRINGSPIGDGKPGPVFREMLKAWSDWVKVDIEQQILTSDC